SSFSVLTAIFCHPECSLIIINPIVVFPLSILLPVRLGLFSCASSALARSRRLDVPGATESPWPGPIFPSANRPAARLGSRSVGVDLRRLVHPPHECRLPSRQIVVPAAPRENAIAQSDPRACRRDKAADLRHPHNQRDLPDVSRFSRHVRPGHNRQPHVFAIQ